MVLVNAESGPDATIPGNWAAHSVVGGLPGMADTAQPGFGFWKQQQGLTGNFDDLDGDGLDTMLEYALGESPFVFSKEGLPQAGFMSEEGVTYLTLSYGENGLAGDVFYQVQQSVDLATWEDVATEQISPTTYRLVNPLTSTRAHFLRLQVRFR